MPSKATRPRASICSIASSPANSLRTEVANHDLIMSMNNTVNPIRCPRILVVFVATALPLPCSRISILYKLFPYQTELGIAPMR